MTQPVIEIEGDPIVVIVTETDWTSYGPPTPRSGYLFSLLENLGGISDSVPPGQYHFNIKAEGLTIVSTLYPFED